MNKSYTYILIVLLFIACGKEELEMALIDNTCNGISRFNQEIDFVEVYGESFLFRNIQTNQQKEFKYSLSESSTQVFNDTILCTHLTYDELTVMKYIADGSDFITYIVGQYFDGLSDFISNVSIQNLLLEGNVIDNSRFLIDNVRLSFINDQTYILTYTDNQGLLIAYDDLNGNQWVLNSLSSDMFFCGVEDNFKKYEDSDEFEIFTRLANAPLIYSDGFSTTATFQIEDQNIFYNYIAEVSEDCPEQSLSINQVANMNLRYRFGNIYNLNLSITPQYESVQSDNKYSLIRIFLWDERENIGIHDITLILDPDNIIQENYTTPNPYVLHETLDLNGKVFEDVYEFTRGKKSLFFNYDHGVLAFTDHLDLINYLKVD